VTGESDIGSKKSFSRRISVSSAFWVMSKIVGLPLILTMLCAFPSFLSRPYRPLRLRVVSAILV